MVESLREKQKQLARETILTSAADEIAERGLSHLSLEAVAERAGVSSRTLYNYYENRDTLLIALGRWSTELTVKGGGSDLPNDLDNLAEIVPTVWQTWESQGTVIDAVQQIAAAGSTGTVAEAVRSDRDRRSASIRDGLSELRPDLPDEEIEELTALFHAIAGSALWHRMKTVYGLKSDRTGPVATWMIRLLVQALREGDAPRRR